MNDIKQIILECMYLSLTSLLTSLPRCPRQFRFNTPQYYFSFISTVTNKVQATTPLTKASEVLFKLNSPSPSDLVMQCLPLPRAHYAPDTRAFMLALQQIKLISFFGPLHTLCRLGGGASAPRYSQS